MRLLDGNKLKLINVCIFLCEAHEPDHTLNIPFPVYIRLSAVHFIPSKFLSHALCLL